ncbi:16S rRNA (uracil1498-N3)-methyltransferase [Caloramator quimbayensis]|uniref:Ribosomal RNA small subunit methyltransferase E n=1 Tax=Caloramator quimbayensis TaxID=1147123 RepID=A0A1T4X8F7_9CLOT|nr:16S rRNA (uracil(1498)-N(3))-methyltransferase [Caloramator quimbayensis]SKA85864.1 16S rRNA (uracil1498-N3)-methyltransferase [Caloramator quimbayensis]
MHKFFISSENIDYKNNRIIITGEDVNHITKVLRLRCGESIKISDGNGNEYISIIETFDKKSVTCSIAEKFKNETEPKVKITLFQALPKAQKMDLIVQKCVEIGVCTIQTVITKRVVVDIKSKDISAKIERWNRIAMEAAKQSDRGIIPDVLEPIEFKDAVEKLKGMDVSVIPYENEKVKDFKDLLKEKQSFNNAGIFIGPEGGFEDEEIKICIENGIVPVTLGPRILRTETAGFVSSTIVLYEACDMGGSR